MFDIFGEFDSAEELNLCAEGLKLEEDWEGLLKLAQENGIMEERAEAYRQGKVQILADKLEAAAGKLEVELRGSTGGIAPVQAITDYLMVMMYEKEALADAIRKKGKSLAQCTNQIAKEAMKLVKERKGMQCVNMPDMTVFRMTEEYYLKGGKQDV